jgi:hypothetical protein
MILVAHHGADAVLLHLAGGVGQHFVVVLQAHPEAALGEQLGDFTFELDKIFFGQWAVLLRMT